jgi:D-sedoheptulose 7-phosphate isomerase
MPDTDPATQFRRRVEQHVSVTQALLDDRYVSFAIDVAGVLTRAIERGGKVLVCGNGGSAADASHLATEFVGRFMIDRRPFAALSLCDNSSTLTAIANDFEFADIFARQVRALGRPGDVLLALSTSGASANVLAAVDAAREAGLQTIGLTGRSGTNLARSVDLCVRVPTDDTARIQEGYMLVGHIICELVERALAK